VEETKGHFPEAIHIYQEALQIDPTLKPALARLWPLLKSSGERTEAMAILERLWALNEATVAEKVELARMYLDTKSELLRAIKLMEEACKRDPDNPRYAQILAELYKLYKKQHPGIVIIRGHGHR
jgi:Tfp pilus assembly protein PilF